MDELAALGAEPEPDTSHLKEPVNLDEELDYRNSMNEGWIDRLDETLGVFRKYSARTLLFGDVRYDPAHNVYEGCVLVSLGDSLCSESGGGPDSAPGSLPASGRRIDRERGAALVRAHNALVTDRLRWVADRESRKAAAAGGAERRGGSGRASAGSAGKTGARNTPPERVLAVSDLNRRSRSLVKQPEDESAPVRSAEAERASEAEPGAGGSPLQSRQSGQGGQSGQSGHPAARPVTYRSPRAARRADGGGRWDLWRWLDRLVSDYPASLVAHDLVRDAKTGGCEGFLLAGFGAEVDETRRAGGRVVADLLDGYNGFLTKILEGKEEPLWAWGTGLGEDDLGFFAVNIGEREEYLLQDKLEVVRVFSDRTLSYSAVRYDRARHTHTGYRLFSFGASLSSERLVARDRVKALVAAYNALVDERLGLSALPGADGAPRGTAGSATDGATPVSGMDAPAASGESDSMPARRMSRRWAIAVSEVPEALALENAGADASAGSRGKKAGKGAGKKGGRKTRAGKDNLWRELAKLLRRNPSTLVAHDVTRDAKSGAYEGLMLIDFGPRVSPRRRLGARTGADLVSAFNATVDDLLEGGVSEEEPDFFDWLAESEEDAALRESLDNLERFSRQTVTCFEAWYSEDVEACVGQVLMSFGDTLGPERRVDKKRGAALVDAFNTLVDMRLGRVPADPSDPDAKTAAGGRKWRQGPQSRRSILSVSGAQRKDGSGSKGK